MAFGLRYVLTAISTLVDLIKLLLNTFSNKCHLSDLLISYMPSLLGVLLLATN